MNAANPEKRFDAFSGFDPMVGMPHCWRLDLEPLIRRARALLKGRSRDQVHAAAASIDWMINEYFAECEEQEIRKQSKLNGILWDLIPVGAEPTEGAIRLLFKHGLTSDARARLDYATAENTSELTALQACIASYSIASDDDFPDAHAYEYFAVLALQLIGDALSFSSPNREVRPVVHANRAFRAPPIRDTRSEAEQLRDTVIGARSAMDAMDAICYAEHLHATERLQEELDLHSNLLAAVTEQNSARVAELQRALDAARQDVEEQVEKRTRDKISISSRKAAIQRHARTRAKRQQAIQFYIEHQAEFRSIEKAAEATASLVKVAHRTAAKWISEFRRTQKHSARRL